MLTTRKRDTTGECKVMHFPSLKKKDRKSSSIFSSTTSESCDADWIVHPLYTISINILEGKRLTPFNSGSKYKFGYRILFDGLIVGSDETDERSSHPKFPKPKQTNRNSISKNNSYTENTNGNIVNIFQRHLSNEPFPLIIEIYRKERNLSTGWKKQFFKLGEIVLPNINKIPRGTFAEEWIPLTNVEEIYKKDLKDPSLLISVNVD
ncbi:hypothetical protein ABK040_002125 [Willaertia magna]